MNQKHMDSISLGVYVGFKIKGEKCVELGCVAKAKCLKTNARHFAQQMTSLPS